VDGSISAEVDPAVQDIEWDDFTKHLTTWGCPECGAEKRDLEDLVEVPEDQIDWQLWRERNPIEGQTKMELT